MPTTFTNLIPVRRVAVGVSASSQGRDGVTELTQTALANLQSLDWTASSEPPFFPVHDYAQNLPRGDAWKACYGYDAAARTERAACGAVVYSFPIPSDALTGAPCDIDAVRFTVVGDRYLDAGVDVHVVLSAYETPPSVRDLSARTPECPAVCATGSQTEAPNKRHGETYDAEVEPGSAATAYVHVALLLADYLGTRGAWIEGGAMLQDAKVEIEFSRDVAEPSAREFALTSGYFSGYGGSKQITRSVGVISPHYRLMYAAYAWDADENAVSLGAPSNPQLEAYNLLLSPSVPRSTVSQGVGASSVFNILGSSAIGFGSVAYSSDGTNLSPSIVAIVRSGLIESGKFSALKLSTSSADAAALPIDVVAYAVASPHFGIMPDASTLCSPSFWAAKSSSISTVAKFEDADKVLWQSDPDDPPSVPAVSLPVVPITTTRIPDGDTFERTITFDPVQIDQQGYPISVLIAFRPAVGASSNTASTVVPDDLVVKLVMA